MLSISIVTYKTDVETIIELLRSLKRAIEVLPQLYKIDSISIVENSSISKLPKNFLDEYSSISNNIEIIPTGKNLGYGAAHDIAINKSFSKYHLILNPDVILEESCLLNGLNYLELNQDVVAISPEVHDDNDEILNITKSYPALFDLLLRAIDSNKLNSIYRSRLEKYENRYIHENKIESDVLLISGCFMLCRNEVLKKVGGFNENYFLYFEDYSLSIETGKYGAVRYFPEMKITHFGGNASRKGLRHILYFVHSAFKFYNQYGWKIY